VCAKFAVHEVGCVSALVRRRPDAMPEQVEEYVAMASEDRTEYFGIPLIRSETCQLFTGTAAPVIEQDGGERSVALGR
jgi:hypothetical protein